jgi:hypothetical protein
MRKFLKSDKKILILSRKLDIKLLKLKTALLRIVFPNRKTHQTKNLKDGDLDLEEYTKIQTAGNKRKIDYVFETEENVKMLSDYLVKHLDEIKFGLCHGTRRGKEQEWFNKYLNAEVLGTEISDTATEFPNTIQWDFHNVKDEWIGNVDFIYSNAIDHSYDAKYCLKQWFSCLRKDGICIINGTTNNTPWSITKLDLFGYTKDGLKSLIIELADESGIKIEKLFEDRNLVKKGFSGWFYFIVRKL